MLVIKMGLQRLCYPTMPLVSGWVHNSLLTPVNVKAEHGDTAAPVPNTTQKQQMVKDISINL